jgi:uncharacterized protein (DUF952 family)
LHLDYGPAAMAKAPICKICGAADWRRAQRTGELAFSADDARDGFIHLSTMDQALQTAERHFAGRADLVLLLVDGDALGAALRWEPSRGGQLFPHLYGPLPLAAVTAAHLLPLGPDGRHVFLQV